MYRFNPSTITLLSYLNGKFKISYRSKVLRGLFCAALYGSKYLQNIYDDIVCTGGVAGEAPESNNHKPLPLYFFSLSPLVRKEIEMAVPTKLSIVYPEI